MTSRDFIPEKNDVRDDRRWANSEELCPQCGKKMRKSRDFTDMKIDGVPALLYACTAEGCRWIGFVKEEPA